MAQTPVFTFGELRFEAGLTALKREKIYGWAETRYTDDSGQDCHFVTLLDGGVALKSLDADGNEIDKSSLVAHWAEDGRVAEQHPSVFEGENRLSTDKGLHDYLCMDVKSVYQLDLGEQLAAVQPLLAEHQVLYMSFCYRAGYDPDDAFLIGQDQHVFLVVGRISEFEWTSLQVQAELDDAPEDEAADDAMDFNMF
jgi:hypothetical protein